MICEEFESLNPLERVNYIGEIIHSVQNDGALFNIGKEIIELAKRKGLFEGVIINPIINEGSTNS